MPDITGERRTIVPISRHAIHLRVPESDYPNGATIAWACRNGDGWRVRVLRGHYAGTVLDVVSRDDAELMMRRMTKGVRNA